MKKSLIALAVLAASGASFAQVSVTGNLNMGFKTGTATTFGAAPTDASGFGVADAEVFFSASEDLGGGMKVAAKLGVNGMTRAAGIGGTDATLALSSAMGTVTLATSEQVRSVDGTVANVGVPGLDNSLFANTTANYDSVSFSTAVGPVALTLRHSEPAAVLGLGTGAAGTATPNQRQNQVGAVYSAGPLSVEAAYASYDNKGVTFGAGNMDNTMTLAGAYDIGVAKFGLGYQNNKMVKGSVVDTVIAVGVPMGALTLGAEWGNRKVDVDGVVAAAPAYKDGNAGGYALQAKYDLSKRTALRARYSRWDSAVGAANVDSYTSLLVMHAF